jgi:hypothetical protein
MKKKIIVAIFVTVSILSLEIILRQYYGFCDNVLTQEDSSFEYIAQPNQHRFRFRNHVNYNSKSMRSKEIDTTSFIILGFGDSVINGGTMTDQDSLATTILSDTLSKWQGKTVQFLNISAGSWGPDNCYEYLKKYGDFGAKSIFLFVSSHDAYDTMNFEKIVDVSVNYSSKQYSLALYELFDKYILPKVMTIFQKNISKNDSLGINKKKDNSVFNSGFLSFLSYSKDKKIPLTLYLHAEKKELKAGVYNDQGKRIIKFATENNIPIILDLKNGLDISDFRDDIHINSKGQRKLAFQITKYIEKKH